MFIDFGDLDTEVNQTLETKMSYTLFYALRKKSRYKIDLKITGKTNGVELMHNKNVNIK